MNFLESQQTVKIPNVNIWITQCSSGIHKIIFASTAFLFSLNNFHGGMKYLNLNKNKFLWHKLFQRWQNCEYA